MTFKEFIRFTYGLLMGTSTPLLKPVQRFLYPTHKHTIDPELSLLLGGSGICAILTAPNGERLVINTNQGAAAKELRAWANEKGQGEEKLILTSTVSDMAGAVSLYSLSSEIYFAGEGSALRAALPEGQGKLIQVEKDRVIEFAGERIHLLPVGPAASGSDLVVFLEKRATLFLGPLFYNRLHPILRPGKGFSPEGWIRALENIVVRFQPKIIVPAEGDLAGGADLILFISYLKDLTDPKTEFSDCRRKYDWAEIPSYTSLEENFDLLHEKVKSHTTLH